MPPTKAVHALFIHGIGQQSADFSDDAQHQLSGALGDRGAVLYGRSVHWAPLLDGPEARALKGLKRGGSAGRLTQRITIGTLADALAYPHYRDSIQYLIDYEVRQLRADRVVIFAHSLGCLIAADYLRTRARVKVDAFVTMGCNLQLFFLGAEDQFDCPPQLTRPGVWTNLFDDDDAIGFPLRGWLPQVADREVSAGGLLTRWWGASHGGYWTTRKIWTDVVPQVILPA